MATTPARGAILVLPSSSAGQQGPVGAFVSTAGWASAMRRVVGESWVVTARGEVVGTETLRAEGSSPRLAPPTRRAARRLVPVVVKTALKDARDWRRARRCVIPVDGPWRHHDVAFVWQRHELFHDEGIDLAAALHVPAVVFVPAPLVWQARVWGVRRPGWGAFVERVGEARALARADVVACGSDAVVEQVQRMGVDPQRTVVTPTGVDVELFARGRGDRSLRDAFGLDGFVVGWVGSFRRFHALEQLVDALAGLEGATLLLVGDGPERAHIEARARAAGVRCVVTGTVPHDDLPRHLGAMDVAVVVAAADAPFHYSPLKLAEYLAAGLPVVAPRAGDLAERLHDGVDAILVPPGDTGALRSALERLRADPAERARLAAGATAAAAGWSWDRSVEILLAAIDRVRPRPVGRQPPW